MAVSTIVGTTTDAGGVARDFTGTIDVKDPVVEPPPGDTTAPSAPTGLAATALSETSAKLTWTAATDNVAVTGYEVYRAGTKVGSPTGTSYTDAAVVNGTSYAYTVKALDAAGNASPLSASLAYTHTWAVTPPPLTGWPDASNTGPVPGTVFTNTSGRTVVTNGQLIQNQNISGTLIVHANNVTIKNCKITSDGAWGIDNQGYNGMTVTNCELLNAQDSAILTGSTCTVSKCNIHKSDHGVTVAGSTVVIQDNWIHDLPGAPGDSTAHFDCLFLDGGYSHVKCIHNSLYGLDTACIFVCNDFGAQDDILLDNNLCIADAVPNRPAIGIYVIEKAGTSAQVTNVTVSNNVMTKGKAYFSIERTEPKLINNKDKNTGAIITG